VIPTNPTDPRWHTRRDRKKERLASVGHLANGLVVDTADVVPLLEAVLRPGDRVALEGNNQKQADFLSRSLAQADPGRVHDLHLLISSISRPEHLDLFENGIASLVDFAFAGAQSTRVATLLAEGTLKVKAPKADPKDLIEAVSVAAEKSKAKASEKRASAAAAASKAAEAAADKQA